MENEILTEKQIKKKIANQKYRAKLKDSVSDRDKQEKQDITSDTESETQDNTSDKQDIAISEGDSENEETFVLDKKSYLYLLEKARSNEQAKETPKVEPKETPKVETPKTESPKQNEEPSFFFLIKNQFKTTAISLLPVLTIQMTMLGAKYIMASQPNLISMKSTTNTPNQQKQQHQQYTQEFVLPQVNSL
jgi:hypothetical protein